MHVTNTLMIRPLRVIYLSIALACGLVLLMQTINNDSTRIHSTQIGHKLALADLSIVRQALAQSKENLQELSKEFQAELKKLQTPSDCTTTHLKCGFPYVHGLGCQIHHRVFCLIVSYTLKIPLIHDEEGWPNKRKWSEAFKNMGSKCSLHQPNELITLHWQLSGVPILEKSRRGLHGFQMQLPPKERFVVYPLADGLKIPAKLNRVALQIYPNGTFRWWIGQFLKYTLRLTVFEKKLVGLGKKRSGFNPRTKTIGMHIRRTDKIRERPIGMSSYHSTLEYFKVAGKYFDAINQTFHKPVFIATDDHNVFQKAKTRFKPPEWEILGLSSNVSMKTEYDRLDKLDNAIADLMILAECDRVICVQTSNWCWLLEEMMYYKQDNGSDRIISLGGEYVYVMFGHQMPLNVIET